MAPKFKVGQQVKAIALPNGFPHPTVERAGLVIADVRLIECSHIPSYYRYKAVDPASYGYYVEGAENFFEATCQ